MSNVCPVSAPSVFPAPVSEAAPTSIAAKDSNGERTLIVVAVSAVPVILAALRKKLFFLFLYCQLSW